MRHGQLRQLLGERVLAAIEKEDPQQGRRAIDRIDLID
jgi:hypothetical protein